MNGAFVLDRCFWVRFRRVCTVTRGKNGADNGRSRKNRGYQAHGCREEKTGKIAEFRAKKATGKSRRTKNARRFTLVDFFAFRYMATPEIIAGLFILFVAMMFVSQLLPVGGPLPWYYRAGRALLAIVLFSINNHLAEISEKLVKQLEKCWDNES
ncbi:MAG TPA: hypothetical protein EYP34_00335 [Chromatiaceae bacterium]|nr:hypothetical protein [Chromatiaceae bacterium]